MAVHQRAAAAGWHRGGGSEGKGTHPAADEGRAGGRKASREVVFKVIGHIKSSTGVVAAGRHVSGNRSDEDREANDRDPLSPLLEDGEGKIPVWNENGERLEGAAIDAEIRSWGLLENRDNLSKAAKALPPEERRQLPNHERYDKRQAAHVVFSLPLGAGAGKEKQVSAAAAATLSETIGQQGHRYIHTSHQHNGRVHVHALIKSQSETVNARGKTRQLRINRTDIDAIRSKFAVELQGRGFDVTATRRIDRPGLRREIEQGRAPLHANKKYNRVRATDKWVTGLEKRAPSWFAAHGLTYLSAANGEPRVIPREEIDRFQANWGTFHAVGQKNDRQAGPLIKALASRYDFPAQAATAFSDFYREDKGLAVWALEKRPEIFGQLADKTELSANRAEIHVAMRAIEREGYLKGPPALSDRHRAALRSRADEEVKKYETVKAVRAHGRDLKAGEGSLRQLAEDYRKVAGHDARVATALEGRQEAPGAPTGPVSEPGAQPPEGLPTMPGGVDKTVDQVADQIKQAREQFEKMAALQKLDRGGRERS